MYAFTVVGSKGTRDEVMELGFQLSVVLLEAGWQGYSGNAPGMDKVLNRAMLKTNAFNGYIFLPWPKFETRDLPDRCFDSFTITTPIGEECDSVIKELIPWYDKLSQGPRKLHSRNVKQIKGKDLKTLSNLVIHSAKGKTSSKPQGGTRTAVVLGQKLNVPTFNLRFYLERVALQIHLKTKYDIDVSETIKSLGDKDWPDKGF